MVGGGKNTRPTTGPMIIVMIMPIMSGVGNVRGVVVSNGG